MQRNSFLKVCLAVGAVVAVPFTALAKLSLRKRIDKPLVVKAGKDRFDKPLPIFDGDTFFTKVSGQDTDGDLYIFESIRDKLGGPSLHLHYEQDEYWYVLEGEFLFQVGEEKFTAKKGDSVFGPRMVPHAFAKTNNGPARLLMAFQPAGKMEEMFKKVSEGAGKGMTEEERNKFFEEHRLKRVGPPLTYKKGV